MRLFWRRLFMLGVAIFVLFALWAVIGVFQKERDSRTLRLEAESQLKDLEKREVALRARIATLETERGQEEALRDAYGVGKDGEAMIQIVDKPTTTSEEEMAENKSWFSRIFWWW